MYLRFTGFGRVLPVIPALTYIPVRIVTGDWEDTHRNAVLSLSLLAAGTVTLIIAASLDKKTGISLLSRDAWTSRFMESNHTFFYLPIRVVGVAMLIGAIGVLFR